MQRKEDVRRTRRRIVAPCALAIFGAVVLMGTFATPARADSDFERGFEDQMGRILAYEAVNLGKHVLFHGVVGPAHAYGSPYPAKVYGRYDRGPGPAHDHWRRVDRYDRHDRHDGYDRHAAAHRHRARHHRERHHHDAHCRHEVSYHYH